MSSPVSGRTCCSASTLPSGDQDVPVVGNSLDVSCSGCPLPSHGTANTFHPPSRSDEYEIRDPSGVHRGKLSFAFSNVTRVNVPRASSRTQMSIV